MFQTPNNLKRVEAAVVREVETYLKERMGLTAELVSVRVTGCTVVIRFREIMPLAERALLDRPSDRELLREVKERLFREMEARIDPFIRQVTGMYVVNSYAGVDLDTGVYTGVMLLGAVLKRAG